ncbi:MAG: archaemetzincin family Zn-dependent metalloprotease [Methanomicrobiaceae archaeon]|nr:archaemetzincin family Zn-dependent metalloprotease [Methanomicrobiaceae archaeon]
MHIKVFWDPQSPEGLQLPVARMLSQILDLPVEVEESLFLLRGFDHGRNQYNAQSILDSLQDVYTRQNGTYLPVLLVVPHDLFIPGLDFVFGLARQRINASIVSTARLTNGYYGRHHSDDDVMDRLVKEGAHEIGHLFGLGHCSDPECIMFMPQTLDDLDRKKKDLCSACRAQLRAVPGEEESGS